VQTNRPKKAFTNEPTLLFGFTAAIFISMWILFVTPFILALYIGSFVINSKSKKWLAIIDQEQYPLAHWRLLMAKTFSDLAIIIMSVGIVMGIIGITLMLTIF
tara:strand:+ start:4141 stop:4449 length:309 start_codon:yes stop_codon:yes gene_type:complete